MPQTTTLENLRISLIATALATSANVLFGLVKLVNLLQITYYYNYSPKVVDIAILSPSADFWMWIFSLLFILGETILFKTLHLKNLPRYTILPCLLTPFFLALFTVNDTTAYLLTIPTGFTAAGLLTYYGDGFTAAERREASSLTLVCTASVLMILEIASASSWILNLFDYQIPFEPTPRWTFPSVDLQLFNLLYPLTSWLFLILLYTWIWIPAAKHLLPKIHTPQRIRRLIEKTRLLSIQNTHRKLKLNNKYLTLCLLLSLATAAFIAYYPYITLPTSAAAGADSIEYYNLLKEMTQKGPLTALEKDRPLFNLLIYAVNYPVGSPEITVRIMPPILAVILSLAVFWFVKVGTGNEPVALLSSFLSALSFHTTVGVYSYIIANWFAIIETLLLLSFLLKFHEKPSWKYLAASTVSGMALLLTHPYTWNIIIITLAAYLVWALLRRLENTDVRPLILLLAANLLFYAAYSLLPFGKGVTGAEGSILQTATLSLSLSSLINLQSNLASMVQNWVGGLLANPLLIILAIAGTLSMRDYTKRYNRIMLAWILIPSAVLLATPAEYFWRITYLTPIQILAAAGLQWATTKLANTTDGSNTSGTIRIAKAAVIILIALFLLNYAMRSVDEATIHLL